MLLDIVKANQVQEFLLFSEQFSVHLVSDLSLLVQLFVDALQFLVTQLPQQLFGLSGFLLQLVNFNVIDVQLRLALGLFAASLLALHDVFWNHAFRCREKLYHFLQVFIDIVLLLYELHLWGAVLPNFIQVLVLPPAVVFLDNDLGPLQELLLQLVALLLILDELMLGDI